MEQRNIKYIVVVKDGTTLQHLKYWFVTNRPESRPRVHKTFALLRRHIQKAAAIKYKAPVLLNRPEMSYYTEEKFSRLLILRLQNIDVFVTSKSPKIVERDL